MEVINLKLRNWGNNRLPEGFDLFLRNKLSEGVVLALEVIPNSKEFKIVGFNSRSQTLRIKTKSKARKGLANMEIERELKKSFNSSIKILSGFKSRKKRILILGERGKIEQLLENL